MDPGLTLATIFFSFIGGVGGLIATLLLFLLLESMNKIWVKKTGAPMPPKILKRGILLASGPMLVAVHAAIRIFFAIGGEELHTVWQLLMFGMFGCYCLLMSTFIYSIFEELNKLHEALNADRPAAK